MPKTVEAASPYIVDVRVPPDDLEGRLNAMSEWHRKRRIEGRNGPGRIEGGVSIIRRCFASAELADAFQAEFGGVIGPHERGL